MNQHDNKNNLKRENRMNNNSSVNVIIVTYNSASTIQNCLMSTLNFSKSLFYQKYILKKRSARHEKTFINNFVWWVFGRRGDC